LDGGFRGCAFFKKGETSKMTRLAVATIAVITLLATFGFGQDSTPKVQVFGGYSLVNLDSGKLTGTILNVELRQHNSPFTVASNVTGWNAQAQYNANRWFGVAADFGGRYGSPIIAANGIPLTGLPKGTGYSFLVGPVLSFRGKSRFTPFLHALFGYDRVSLSGSTISGGTSAVPVVATTYTDAAVAVGGGVDFRLFRHIGLRLAQLDDFYTTHNLNRFYENAFGTTLINGLATHQRNLRVSTGVMVSF
jgi:opacity protein-like surface antigen